jgi:formate dehydrogenase beta subunit
MVGAGPASLTVARDLAPLGYDVVIFDGESKLRRHDPQRRSPVSACPKR